MKLTVGIPQIRKLHMTKKQKKIAIGICVALVLIIIPYIIIQAKFMRKSNAKSVSTASGFYFSSNKLSELKIGNDGDITDESDRVEYVIEGWDGKSPVAFDFDIRDYENPLLYNNDNQFLEYTIEYSIVEEDEEDGENEEDVIDEETEEDEEIEETEIDKLVNKVNLKLTSGDQVIANGVAQQLEKSGNKYNSKNYKLAVSLKEGVTEITKDLKLKIDVKTTDNSPYKRALGATVVFKYTASTSYLEKAKFRETTEKYESREITNDDYALVFEIGTTVGSIERGDTSNAVTRLHYTWYNDKLGFDRFNDLNKGIDADSFKTATLNVTTLPKTDKTGKIVDYVKVTEENMSEFTNVLIIDEDNNKGHLFFDTVAYSYYTIVMYKKNNLNITPEVANSNKYGKVEQVNNNNNNNPSEEDDTE